MIKQFTPNIFVSGRDEVFQKETLQSLGITAIFNVAEELDDPQYSPLEFTQIKIGFSDNDKNPGWLKNLGMLTLRSLLDNGKKVLIHCMGGASRSPYFAVRYIAETEHRTIEAVYQEFIATLPPGQITVSPLNYGI